MHKLATIKKEENNHNNSSTLISTGMLIELLLAVFKPMVQVCTKGASKGRMQHRKM
jgi:hypothetical protein